MDKVDKQQIVFSNAVTNVRREREAALAVLELPQLQASVLRF